MATSGHGSGPGPPFDPGANTNTEGDTADNKGNTANTKGAESTTNYAKKASAKAESKWLHLHLHREDKNIPYNLSKKEKAILVFRRLKLEKKDIISIESCDFEQIRVELNQSVNIENLKTSTAIQIRPGLKVQPMKEMKRTTRVKVCWVKLDVPDEEIVKTLSMFGKVSGGVEHLTFELTEEESKDSDLYQLTGIKNGERAVEVELFRNIPSFVKIAGKKARIWYPGQNFSCGRCFRSFKSCPGRADRRECLRLKGKERDFDDFWREVMNTNPRREPMAEDDKYDTDTIDLARVPVEVTKEELLAWIQSKDIGITEDFLAATQFPGTWKVTKVPSEAIMKQLVERLHGAKIRNKAILAMPIKMPTPTKPQQQNNREGEGMEVDEMSTGTETAAAKAERLARQEDETRKAVEKERLRMEKEKKTRKEKEGQGGLASEDGVTGGPVGPRGTGGESAAAQDQAKDTAVSPENSTNIFENVKHIGNRITEAMGFGHINKKGPINVNSSAHPDTLTPNQTKQSDKDNKMEEKQEQKNPKTNLISQEPKEKRPVSRGRKPPLQAKRTNSKARPAPTSGANKNPNPDPDPGRHKVLVTETPAQDAAPTMRKDFVKETPAEYNASVLVKETPAEDNASVQKTPAEYNASPKLKKTVEDHDESVETISSGDEIFSQDPTAFLDITKPLVFQSDYAKRLSMCGDEGEVEDWTKVRPPRERRKTYINDNNKRGRINLTSEEGSNEKPAPVKVQKHQSDSEKEKPTSKVEASKMEDEVKPTSPALTKGQKKALKKKEKREQKNLKKLEEARADDDDDDEDLYS